MARLIWREMSKFYFYNKEQEMLIVIAFTIPMHQRFRLECRARWLLSGGTSFLTACPSSLL